MRGLDWTITADSSCPFKKSSILLESKVLGTELPLGLTLISPCASDTAGKESGVITAGTCPGLRVGLSLVTPN